LKLEFKKVETQAEMAYLAKRQLESELVPVITAAIEPLTSGRY